MPTNSSIQSRERSDRPGPYDNYFLRHRVRCCSQEKIFSRKVVKDLRGKMEEAGAGGAK
jgi:hypothetical protein